MTNDKIDKVAEFSLGGPGPQSSIIQLFDLGQLFVNKKMVAFTAFGTCMYPCICPGDAIYIQPKTAEEMAVGEVAVYRRNNRLFSHRTIAKGTGEKGAYIITRPDTAKYGDDGLIFDTDILGIAAQIGRKGKILEPIKRNYSLMKKIWLGLCLKCFCFKQFLLRRVIFFLTFLQQFGLYRLMAELVSKNFSKRMGFIFYVPAHGNAASAFCQKISEDELSELLHHNDNGPVPKWTVALKIDSKEPASMSFLLKPDNGEFRGWWLVGARIRIRHRGTVVEKALLEKTDSLLRQAGSSEIFAGVSRNLNVEKMFLNGLGFTPVHAHTMRRNVK